jgi:hypothetical protein
VRGGEIVAQGTPDQVADESRSYTGQYLKPMLERAREAAEWPAQRTFPVILNSFQDPFLRPHGAPASGAGLAPRPLAGQRPAGGLRVAGTMGAEPSSA